MLSYWVSTDHGPQCLQFPHQEAIVFCRPEDTEQIASIEGVRLVQSHLKHFSQKAVTAVYCRQYRTLRAVRRFCQERSLPLWEAEIKPTERFMMERFIRGSVEWASLHGSVASVQSGYPLIMQPKVRPSEYLPRLKVCSIDIETSMPTKHQKEKLYSIGFSSRWVNAQGTPKESKRVFMLGDPSETHPAWLFLFKNLKQLLKAVNEYVAELDPDVFIGWNVINFDFSVLARIYAEHQIPFNWTRDGSTIRIRQSQNHLTFADIPGRVIIDGIDALKNATYHFDSYALQYVSEHLLGEGKNLAGHDGPMHDRGQAITDLFNTDKSALARYNLQDCDLVLNIFEHTQLLEYLIQRGQLTGHLLDRVGGSVAAFEYLYLPKLHRAGYVAPNLMEGYSEIKAPGGFVMDSRPGMYEDVLVLDFKSLYPSIIRTFKVDPMGLVEGLLQQDQEETVIPGFHGAFFHRERHFLPDIITQLWAQRDVAKQQKNGAASQAIKIIMNSFYGVLGSYGCRFFDARLAASITERGHEIIQASAQWIHEQGFQVIYGDTDSVFVYLNKKVDSRQAKSVGKSLQEGLNLYWQATLKERFNLTCHLEIEFEDHYTQFLMPTIRGSELGSKKRYAGLTQNGKMVFKGLEAVRSDWTPLAKEVQQTLYHAVFHQQPYHEFLQNVVNDLKQGKLDHQLIYRKRIRKPLDHYQKNVPPQIQAAKKAAEHYQSLDQSNPYEHGGWIEYVITTQGPEAIECQHAPLDYQHYLEKQVAPVADGILHFLGQDFQRLTHPQQDIFGE